MGNHSVKQERFSLLLQQLAIPPEFIEKYFYEGQIEKVDVYRETKKWHFTFRLPALLPLNVYQAFHVKLVQAFNQIAAVDCTMQYNEPVPLPGFLQDYWPWIVEQVSPHINSTASYLKEAAYELVDRKIKLGVPNEIAIEMMKRRNVDEWIAKTVEKLCGEKVVLTYNVVQDTESYQQFVEKREEEDRTRALEALTEKRKRRRRAAQVRRMCLRSFILAMILRTSQLRFARFRRSREKHASRASFLGRRCASCAAAVHCVPLTLPTIQIPCR